MFFGRMASDTINDITKLKTTSLERLLKNLMPFYQRLQEDLN